ncbi:UvrD-helicase domain-containing protein [uncultured Croceitalea sp.]|uniref:UvrD-helicase domain-containing protein n=1 Tax=uncultured Croceitalea sp. TaxID=1798908 RepID=UPI003305A593
MSISGFKIYNASAGSGKTYQLTKNYLELILGPNSRFKYKQLLAITFTNKAVGEMKERILQNLYEFSLSELSEKAAPLFKEIRECLGYSEEELREKSKLTLKELLHNYAFFEISTIDKFNHKIIRTFARDLKLAQNFEVVLDTESLLNHAVAKVLNKAGDNKKLTDTLIAFALEKIEGNKSWNIAFDLNAIGKILFQENHSEYLNLLKDKSIEDFSNLKKLIKQRTESLSASTKEKAGKVLKRIDETGFKEDDFPRGTLPNHFKKIIDSELDPKKLYNNKLEEQLNNDKIVKASVSAPTNELSSFILVQYLEIKNIILRVKFYQNVYKHILPLTLINEISKEVKSIQIEQSLLSISEFNQLIAAEIKNQPVPFIYERLGEKYRHYFIDEFQDTSKKQWSNLIPLIGNALESENEKGDVGSLLLVGDVKQAIYRWRGGEANQFLDLSLKKERPFVVDPTVTQLDKNWRSHAEIIKFNNTFFSFIAKRLQNKDYQNLYLDGNQQLKNNKKEGLVEISFLEEDRQVERHPHCEKTLGTVQRIISKGYDYEDICILVRDNRNGVLLADHLTQAAIPVLSAEALLLKNNEEVHFLVNLLRLIVQPTIAEYCFEVLSYLSAEKSLSHDFIAENLLNAPSFLKAQYDFDLGNVQFLTAYEILEVAILKFQLVNDSNAYLSYFLDVVFDFGKKESVAVFDFLKHWEQKKDKLAIAAPEHMNAVQIMTIHKSKGLEFPFVIFPFANTKINDTSKSNDLWIPVNKEDFYGFEALLVKASNELDYYSKASKAYYHREIEKTELDDFNVLYVALTRAIKGLFVITTNEKSKTAVSYSSLLKDFLEFKGLWGTSTSTYCFGSFAESEFQNQVIKKELVVPYIYAAKASHTFELAQGQISYVDSNQQKAVEYGNFLHLALSRINTIDDVEPSLKSLVNENAISKKEQNHYKNVLTKIVQHEQLKPYFASNVVAHNEIELMDGKGTILRPDRIVIQDRAVTIIDYKTGSSKKVHKNQLQEYANVISEMGYFVSDKILVYIDESVNPIFI